MLGLNTFRKLDPSSSSSSSFLVFGTFLTYVKFSGETEVRTKKNRDPDLGDTIRLCFALGTAFRSDSSNICFGYIYK
jgi:hypothetical protein